MSAVTTEVLEELLCQLVNEEAERQYWEDELTKAGLSLTSDAVCNRDRSLTSRGVNEGKFGWQRPRRLPPWKPKTTRKPRPSRAMDPFAEEKLRRERRDESIGIVSGDPRPFGARSVECKSRGLSERDRKSLIRKMYDPYLVIPALAPPMCEGEDGAYLIQDDRRKASCGGADDQAEKDDMPDGTGSAFANIPTPHAVYRLTGQANFERRLKEYEVRSAIEGTRISSAEVQWALMEICVKGRRPSDVAAERENLDPKKLYVQAKRIRLRVRGPEPKDVKPEGKTTHVPIAVKTVVIDGVEHIVNVYPPATRRAGFARRKR
jgi:hypothetical protein